MPICNMFITHYIRFILGLHLWSNIRYSNWMDIVPWTVCCFIVCCSCLSCSHISFRANKNMSVSRGTVEKAYNIKLYIFWCWSLLYSSSCFCWVVDDTQILYSILITRTSSNKCSWWGYAASQYIHSQPE